ncbi:MAG: IS3 family transposase [Limnochordia bacterium]
MSRKGCSSDNAACERFCGLVKTDVLVFYTRSWARIFLQEFVQALDTYIRWWNEQQIKMSLGAKNPLGYR